MDGKGEVEELVEILRTLGKEDKKRLLRMARELLEKEEREKVQK